MTGTDGYLGSVIAPDLISAGHEVTGVDTGFFRSGWLYHSGGRRPATMTKDIREIVLEDLKTFDAVVHLGAQS